MIQQALHASNMYQVHTKHMQDTVINAHKMIEICQNSERNKGPQERPLGHTADDRDRFWCLILGDFLLRAVEEKGLNPFVRVTLNTLVMDFLEEVTVGNSIKGFWEI